ncbi:HAD family hydrolase [Undibacterium sp. Di27W]
MEKLNDLLADAQAVVFDVYGTIVEIRNKRGPFKKLLQLLAKKGRPPQADDAAKLMSMSADLSETAKFFGFELTAQELAPLEEDLQLEIDSLSLYPDTTSTLLELRKAGLKIAVCSNLAGPYAAPVMALLPVTLDAYIWSFEVRAIKPEPIIYSSVSDALNIAPSKILFVGDTLLADYIGPQSIGMRSVHLNRNNTPSANSTINSLAELVKN